MAGIRIAPAVRTRAAIEKARLLVEALGDPDALVAALAAVDTVGLQPAPDKDAAAEALIVQGRYLQPDRPVRVTWFPSICPVLTPVPGSNGPGRNRPSVASWTSPRQTSPATASTKRSPCSGKSPKTTTIRRRHFPWAR